MSVSTLGNQFSYNLTPSQRQSLAQALAGQTGQPVQNDGGPISPLSLWANGMQGNPSSSPTNQQRPQQNQLPLEQDTQQAALADGAAPADASLQGDSDIGNALDDQYAMSLLNGLGL